MLRQRLCQRPPIVRGKAEEFVARFDDPWKMSLEQRWELFHYWIDRYIETDRAEQQRRIQNYCEEHKQFQELRNQADVNLLKHAKVIMNGFSIFRALFLFIV